MKNIGALVTVAVMLLAGLVAFLLWGPFGEKPGLREITPEGVPPAAGAPEAASEPGGKAGAGRPSGRIAGGMPPVESSSAPDAAPAAAATPAAPVVAPAKPVRRFPQGQDIAIGTEKSVLQSVYGRPTMRTTAVEGGRLLETWVYLQSEPNLATFILLRNGRVVSANTTVY